MVRYWSSSLVMRWWLLSTGQEPVEERQEDVLDNIGGTGQYWPASQQVESRGQYRAGCDLWVFAILSSKQACKQYYPSGMQARSTRSVWWTLTLSRVRCYADMQCKDCGAICYALRYAMQWNAMLCYDMLWDCGAIYVVQPIPSVAGLCIPRKTIITVFPFLSPLSSWYQRLLK